jgi:DNA-binding MarR family transcriptional regulator
MAEERWLDDREQRAWRGLLTMQSRLEARLRRALQQDSGLSDADYAVLVNLSEAPGGRLRIFELAAALDWEKSRLSHQLRRMEQRRLLEREGCETDRRGSFVVLTATGRSAIEAAAPEHVAEVRRWFIDRLAPAQLDALAEISETILDALAADELPCGMEAGREGR